MMHLSTFLAAFLLCTTTTTANALVSVGSRVIKCKQPVGGSAGTDAVLEPTPVIPGLTFFVGMQGLLPTTTKCPVDVQLQAPWFNGVGGGICPPNYWNLGAAAPGIALLVAAVGLYLFFNENRLLVNDIGIGLVKVQSSSEKDLVSIVDNDDDMVPFDDVGSWNVFPFGLVLTRKSTGSTQFFPVNWNAKDMEALMSDRVGN